MLAFNSAIRRGDADLPHGKGEANSLPRGTLSETPAPSRSGNSSLPPPPQPIGLREAAGRGPAPRGGGWGVGGWRPRTGGRGSHAPNGRRRRPAPHLARAQPAARPLPPALTHLRRRPPPRPPRPAPGGRSGPAPAAAPAPTALSASSRRSSARSAPLRPAVPPACLPACRPATRRCRRSPRAPLRSGSAAQGQGARHERLESGVPGTPAQQPQPLRRGGRRARPTEAESSRPSVRKIRRLL